jgi:hypothetical protein
MEPQQQREFVRQPLGTRPVNHHDVNSVAVASSSSKNSVQPQKNQYVSSSSHLANGIACTPNHHQQQHQYNHHQMQYGNAMIMMTTGSVQQHRAQTFVRGTETTNLPFKSPTTLNFERILGAGK